MYPSDRDQNSGEIKNKNIKPPQKSLQLLLFVDNRHSSQQNIQDIKNYLQSLTHEYQFQLEVLEISKYPHLVEHFKLVATPALVKVNPAPQQTLAGSNLTAQLQKWWDKWQYSLTHTMNSNSGEEESILQTCLPSSDLIRMSDDIFQLKQEVENLQQQLNFKDQMLAMLVHDLRNPLTAASLAVETIELAINESDQEKIFKLQKRLCQQSKKQFKVMNKMISDLLETSKKTNHQLNIIPVKVNLPILCNELLNSFNQKIQVKNQVLIRDIPQDLPPVYADPELINQVLINLIENAIKYTPNDGTITVAIIHKTTQKIEVSIIDTGSGIPPEKKERIFDGHFRLERDIKQEGYGIGLALCRQVINAHYGQIWVDDNGNQGSCFRFTLPVYL
ncbi:histidine kinase [Cyanobacterium stanieri LEGE 03274]|uniref:Adaptive-response sensory-kinase SasA n=1 Tax=Cyanobacterium stanieri LEGE 03274 TaxID=1828756 RepID=A0ABR9V718_9CHRO|nr:histidine kinase [Cyanobacterium stanieri]MBE9223687.1 histidine kinase [Cyanobacterium stanieri LEGE 03274]